MKSYLSSSSLASYYAANDSQVSTSQNSPSSAATATSIPRMVSHHTREHSHQQPPSSLLPPPWHSPNSAESQQNTHARSHSTNALLDHYASRSSAEFLSDASSAFSSARENGTLPQNFRRFTSPPSTHYFIDYILSIFKEISLFFFIWHPFRERTRRKDSLRHQKKHQHHSDDASNSEVDHKTHWRHNHTGKHDDSLSGKDHTATLTSKKSKPPRSHNPPEFHSHLQRAKDLDSMFSTRSIIAGWIFLLFFIMIPLCIHFYNIEFFTFITHPLRVQVVFLKLLFKMDVSRLLMGCFLRFFTSFAPTIDDNVWHHDIPGTIRGHATRMDMKRPTHDTATISPHLDLDDAEHARQWNDFLIHSEETGSQPMKFEHELFFRDLDMDYIVIGASKDPHGIYGWVHSPAQMLHNEDFYPAETDTSLQLHLDWMHDEKGMHQDLSTFSPYDDFTYLFTWSDLYMNLKSSLAIMCVISLNLVVAFWMMRFMRRNWKKSRKVGSYKIIAPRPNDQLRLMSSTYQHASSSSLDVPAPHVRSFSFDSYLANESPGGDAPSTRRVDSESFGGRQLQQLASAHAAPDSRPNSPVPQFDTSATGCKQTSPARKEHSDPWQFPNFDSTAITRRRDTGSSTTTNHSTTSTSTPSLTSPHHYNHHHHHLSSPNQFHHSSSFDGLSPSTFSPNQLLMPSSALESPCANLGHTQNNNSAEFVKRPVPTLVLPQKKQKGLMYYLHLGVRYYLGNIYLGFIGLLHILLVLFSMNDYSLYSARLVLLLTGILYFSVAIFSGLYCSEARNHIVILHVLRWISTVCFFVYTQFEIRQIYVKIMVDSGHGFSESMVVESMLGIPVWLYGSMVCIGNGLVYVIFLRYSSAQIQRCALVHSDKAFSHHFWDCNDAECLQAKMTISSGTMNFDGPTEIRTHVTVSKTTFLCEKPNIRSFFSFDEPRQLDVCTNFVSVHALSFLFIAHFASRIPHLASSMTVIDPSTSEEEISHQASIAHQKRRPSTEIDPLVANGPLSAPPDQIPSQQPINSPAPVKSTPKSLPDKLKATLKEVTPWLCFTAFVAVMSSFQFGYSIGVINTPKEAISQCEQSSVLYRWIFPDCVEMSDFQWSVMVSMQTVGGLIGGLSGGTIADFLGRRTTLWMFNVLYLLALWMQALTPWWLLFCFGRLMIGVAAGITSIVVPMYIGEISPDAVRGGFGVLPQLAITTGIFVSQLLGIFMSSRPAWRFLMGWPVVLVLLQMLIFPFCPESPRWLANKRKFVKSERAINKLRRDGPERDYEFQQMRRVLDQKVKASTIKQIAGLFRLSLLKPLIIGIGLNLAQQLSGINVVFYYSTDIFKGAGVARPDIATAVVGLINVIVTLIVAFLMDLLGRRTLLLMGQSAQIVFFTLLSVASIVNQYVTEPVTSAIMSWISIVCVVGFVMSFAIGLGAIPWLILAEIFPDDARAYLSSICVGTNWVANFIVALTFPTMATYMQAYCFLPFIAVLIFFLVFTIIIVPETKGKSMEEGSGSEANAKFEGLAVVPSADSLDGLSSASSQ
eukprot:CAMPEP_0117435774 /NCGR_PEP_ID=MMETSP0759-20121206/656_1 /TAXON_ID=63605 /ORGANISM="Percolomonas cosmopolitus, Strain WS" /LENGTH=1532 /DNA_ID=CAMNT_0005227335 /DNA_START=583 /DNA_END=5184 /DNA_ORIENTATION=+